MGLSSFERDDLALLLVAAHWPLLVVGVLALVFSGLKLRGCSKSLRNMEKFFENFRVGGHRGSPTMKPENTMESMAQAVSEGVDLIEFDVSLTRDGVAVILHDDTLDRTTDMSGPVRNFLHHQLKKCNAAAKFSENKENVTADEMVSMALPTLEELVQWAKDRRMKMIFDVKDTDKILCEKLHELFSTHDLYSSSAVCSFHPQVIYRLKQQHPEIPTGLTWRRWQYSSANVEGTIPKHSSRPRQWLAVLMDILNAWSIRSTLFPRFLGADLVLTHRAEISEGYVKLMRRKGLEVCAWTVNDADEMLWMHRTLQIPFLTDVPFVARSALLRGTTVEEEKCVFQNGNENVPVIVNCGSGGA